VDWVAKENRTMQFNAATIIFLLPSLLTLIVLLIKRQPRDKILSVLGWRLGAPIHYLWAFLILLPAALLVVLFRLFVLADFYEHPLPGTTLYNYARLGFSLGSVAVAFLNEFLFTALGEEAFFRGWLGGWLMRRFGFWVGNTLQALIFLLPHLLLLLAGANLWPLLVLQVVFGWLVGWLRYKSDSILPGMLVHALVNTLSDTLAMLAF
jgi:uncharacterized protein